MLAKMIIIVQQQWTYSEQVQTPAQHFCASAPVLTIPSGLSASPKEYFYGAFPPPQYLTVKTDFVSCTSLGWCGVGDSAYHGIQVINMHYHYKFPKQSRKVAIL
jgi:hypothetical protein